MLTVEDLTTVYAEGGAEPVRAADRVSFSVPEGRFFTLLGPSGCGKTTTLRSIAGLERPVEGEVWAHGRVVSSPRLNVFVPPSRRNFGMVFQSYAIWPHLNVFENAAFPLRVRRPRTRAAEIREKVMRVLSAVSLDQLAEREATQLSGGQQQRLALARALVMEPALLLLDEPLSNLDAKLRDKMRFELKRIQRELGLTTVYVTHDQSEALALSHRIAVMDKGRIVQIGSPREIYEHPATSFVADFIGNSNFLDGTFRGQDGNMLAFDTAVGTLLVARSGAMEEPTQVSLSIRPEDVILSEPSRATAGAPNTLTGVVEAKIFLGECVDFKVKVDGVTLLARVHPSLRTPVGGAVRIEIDPEKCVVLRDRFTRSEA